MGPCALAPCPDTQASFDGEGLLCLPAAVPSREVGASRGRHWHARKKKAEERGSWAHHPDLNSGSGSPPEAVTPSVQSVAAEGLWAARKGGVGKLRMAEVSKAPDTRRPLVLTGLTTGGAPGAVLCHLPRILLSLVNKTSLNSGQFLLEKEEAYCWAGRAHSEGHRP